MLNYVKLRHQEQVITIVIDPCLVSKVLERLMNIPSENLFILSFSSVIQSSNLNDAICRVFIIETILFFG